MKKIYMMLAALLLVSVMACTNGGDNGSSASSAKAVTAFTLDGVVGTVDEAGKTIAVTMPFGTVVTALIPTITLTGASISPSSGVAQDFTAPVDYTVTEANGSTEIYTVTVTMQASSLPKTGQTTSYDADDDGEDGDLEPGVAWPDPRFTDNGDGTISDNLTGLMWTQDGNAPGPPGCDTGGPLNTADALNYVACLNANSYLGYSDWRLPNVNELQSLVHYGESDPAAWLNTQGFSAQSAWYRSSTTNASNTSQAWVVMMGNGNVFGDGSKLVADRVWPVRDGQFRVVDLPKTGQTTLYDTGDDGDLEQGVAWPDPRFTTNGDQTITDNLTGLIWSPDGQTWGPGGCPGIGLTKTWQAALDHVECLNTNSYLGYNDWRLPNVNELKSLLHYAESDSATWLNTHGFTRVQGTVYWSSDTCVAYDPLTTYAWYVRLGDGWVFNDVKATSFCYVWSVRGGQ